MIRSSAFAVAVVVAASIVAGAVGDAHGAGWEWKKGSGSSKKGLKLDGTHWVGAAFQVENVTLFAVYGPDELDLGKFLTLDEALAKGKAEVREKSSSGTVNTLVIQNNSAYTVIVLAGTVVIGGKQDRQIGQDFIIPPWKTVPIDAFCVEHGRWNAARDGESTGGKFGSAGMLANQKVRAAAQYKGDQSGVWDEVSKVNAETRKEAATGTLLATLGDKEVASARNRLTDEMEEHLDDVDHADELVGLAYAIDGEVRGARWFGAHAIYEKFEPTLLNTIATEAVTAQAAAKAKGHDVVTTEAEEDEVQDFVQDLKEAKVSDKKKTSGGNENRYKETGKGYSSECTIDVDGEAQPVTTDFLSK